MLRPATSLAVLTALALAGLSVPAEAQRRGREQPTQQRDYGRGADRGRDVQRDLPRERPQFDRREQGGPAGCRGGGSVIGAIAGGLVGSGPAGRPC